MYAGIATLGKHLPGDLDRFSVTASIGADRLNDSVDAARETFRTT
jgi:hypothetical protein